MSDWLDTAEPTAIERLRSLLVPFIAAVIVVVLAILLTG